MRKKPRNEPHAVGVLTYGEIHLHISVAIDTIRARWPNDSDEQLIERMTVTARRILKMRHENTPVIYTRNDLKD